MKRRNRLAIMFNHIRVRLGLWLIGNAPTGSMATEQMVTRLREDMSGLYDVDILAVWED